MYLRQSKKLGSWLLVLSILAGCSLSEQDSNNKPHKKQEGTIRIGMSGSYFPFTFSRDNRLQGFEVDLWQEIGQRLDRPVEFVTANFSGLFGMLEAGKIDTISNQITKTPARAQKYLFSDTYVFDGAQIVVHKDNDQIQGFKDLCHKTVAVNLGSNYEHLLKSKDSHNCIEVKTYDTGFEHDVIIGRTDAFVMDRNSVLATIKSADLPLKLAGIPIDYMENALPFTDTKSGRALKVQVNQTLKAMREDGSLKAISVKWFDTNISVRHPQTSTAMAQ